MPPASCSTHRRPTAFPAAPDDVSTGRACPPGLPRPLVLGGGLDAGNVAEAIRRVRPWAVDVSSGVEARGADGRPVKGIKDPARIAAFIEEVRHADG